jgi:hypothetical protein
MREERPAARRTAQIFTDTPLPPDAARSFFQAGITLQHIASTLQIATTATLGNMTCNQTISSSEDLTAFFRGEALPLAIRAAMQSIARAYTSAIDHEIVCSVSFF